MTKLAKNNFQPGTLVRTVFFDEYVEQDPEFWELGDEPDYETGYCPPPLNLEGIVVYSDLKSAKLADSAKDPADEEVGNWEYLPFGKRAMIVEQFQAPNKLWYKILVNEKTVWTYDLNLTVLTEP